MAEISLCMIVKNEEAVLSRCLESVKDAVDEIIIVDTGSTDRTKEIAARYTDLVYDFAWIDDFSAARNFSFSKATKEFTMWLDADDILTEKDCAALIALKPQIPDTVNVVVMRYHTAFDEEGNPTFSYNRERLLRTSAGFVWEGCVHEAIHYSGPVLYSEIGITHRSVKEGYSDRNLRIYEKQIEKGIALTPRDSFYFGRELYYHGQYERAKTVLQTFLREGNGWLENKIDACKVLSDCCKATGDVSGALQALMQAFQYDLPRAEICCKIGGLFFQEEAYPMAIFWYQLALTRPKEEQGNGFCDLDCYGFLPCIQLCVCYDRIGDYEKAEAYNRKAGEYRPFSPAYLQNLVYFANRNSNPRAFS